MEARVPNAIEGKLALVFWYQNCRSLKPLWDRPFFFFRNSADLFTATIYLSSLSPLPTVIQGKQLRKNEMWLAVAITILVLRQSIELIPVPVKWTRWHGLVSDLETIGCLLTYNFLILRWGLCVPTCAQKIMLLSQLSHHTLSEQLPLDWRTALS